MNLQPFTGYDYLGWDSKSFPNGDAPLIASTKELDIVIGGEQGELFKEGHEEALMTWDTSEYQSAQDAIDACMAFVEVMTKKED